MGIMNYLKQNRRTCGIIFLLNSINFHTTSFAFPGQNNEFKTYNSETETILNAVLDVTSPSKDTAFRTEKGSELRELIKKWVAKYRRDPKYTALKSFSNTYTVVNAITGHFNNFGTGSPIPKKRLERILQEVEKARPEISLYMV